MIDILNLFSQLIDQAREDIDQRFDTEYFRVEFDNYRGVIEPSLKRYKSHANTGKSIKNDELKSRYQIETAILHVLTRVLGLKVNTHEFKWPVEEENNCYNWYQLSDNLLSAVDNFASQLSTPNDLAVILAHISELLNKTSQRYIGEFYTPLPIVEHLIGLSGFEPVDVLFIKRIIDPACGGGIILATIAEKVVSYALKENKNPQEVLAYLSKNLYGFDIQPFAVTLTKSWLLYKCIPLLTSINSEFNESLFPHICLSDPLAEQIQFWDIEHGFDYIIGNPPFMSVKKGGIEYIQTYDEVLYGHPNLYQLFLWWAVKSAAPQGKISFLLPQSLLAGNYFKKLRQKLNEHTNLISVTRMIDRKGVVGNADQQMMAICLEVSDDKTSRPENVIVRVTRNGDDILQATPTTVSRRRLVQQVDDSAVIWVVSENALDYAIIDRLESRCQPLAKTAEVYSGNGGYVWNQNKNLIRQTEAANSIPLISAASIEPYGFTFPYVGQHPSRKRQFSLLNQKVMPKAHTGAALVIQRITPRKVGRRLVAGMLSEPFQHDYPTYFLENHVNYIKVNHGTDLELLYGLMGWLNSDLINFIFQLRNGTSQVSLFELGLLPVNLEIMKQLAIQTKNIVNSSQAERSSHIQQLNETLFEWLGLDAKDRSRIEKVLSRKERAKDNGGKR